MIQSLNNRVIVSAIPKRLQSIFLLMGCLMSSFLPFTGRSLDCLHPEPSLMPQSGHTNVPVVSARLPQAITSSPKKSSKNHRYWTNNRLQKSDPFSLIESFYLHVTQMTAYISFGLNSMVVYGLYKKCDLFYL